MVKGSASSAASDDAGLLGNLSQRSDNAGLPHNEESSAKRLCLRRADYVGTQIFQQVVRGPESESGSDSDSEDPYDSADETGSENDALARLAQRYDEGELGQNAGDDDDLLHRLAGYADQNETDDGEEDTLLNRLPGGDQRQDMDDAAGLFN